MGVFNLGRIIMKKMYVFSLLSGLALAVQATQAAAPQAVALVAAAHAGDAAEIRRLIAAGADVNAPDPYGNTALIWAASRGDANIVQALLAVEGIDVNVQEILYGETALIGAARNGYAEIVQALLAVEGIDLNAQNKFGWTALIWAANKGHTNIVQALLEAGADKTITNQQNQTAADYARRFGHHAIKAMLEEAYVKPARQR